MRPTQGRLRNKRGWVPTDQDRVLARSQTRILLTPKRGDSQRKGKPLNRLVLESLRVRAPSLAFLLARSQSTHLRAHARHKDQRTKRPRASKRALPLGQHIASTKDTSG